MKALKSYKVLVVDDQPENLDIIVSIVEELGPEYEGLQALNATMGLMIAREEQPDLIITDWEMPEMDGIELIRELRRDKSTREIPVMMCTGRMTTSSHLQTALEAGAVDFVRKPIDTIELQSRLRSMLELADSFQTIKQQMSMLELQKEEIRRSKQHADQLLVEKQAALERAENSEKAKEQFLANMSHEIRTPLNAIIGFTDLLLKDELTERQAEFLETIHASGENLLVIINDILDFSKIEAGMLEIEAIDFNIESAVRSCEAMLRHKAESKGLDFTVAVHDEVPRMLVGDPVRLSQIVINLVNNGIKFTEQGSVNVSVALEGKDNTTARIAISIVDSGIGIPAEKLDSIFESFTQASSDTTRKYGGTGLGTTIVKRLAQLQGGDVTVQSVVNEGSTFRVVIPYKLSDQPITETAGTSVFEPVKLAGYRVLVADDNPVNQRLAEEVLTDFGVEVFVVENGQRAVEAVQRGNIDLVLMDLEMPVMDGLQATKTIRQLDAPIAQLPIIAMTAHSMTSHVEKCREAGMQDHVPKPFRQQELYAKLSKHLTGHVQPLMDPNAADPKQTDKPTLLDLSYLNRISKGNDAFVVEMLTMVQTNTTNELDRINRLLPHEDWETIRSIAHKAASNLMMTGNADLRQLFKAIETAADEQPTAIPVLARQTEALWTAVSSAITFKLKEIGA